MEPFWRTWSFLEPAIKDAHFLMFLDFDGTLTAIRKYPHLATLSPTSKKILKKLSNTPQIQVVFISGRSIHDLKNKINLPSAIYIGNHGLEFESSKLKHVQAEAKAFQKIETVLAASLKKAFRDFKKILIERKTYSITVHYRNLEPHKIKPARRILDELMLSWPEAKSLVLQPGKKVWEIRPQSLWHKGTMSLWALARFIFQVRGKVFPIYFGDDVMDELAFKALAKKGLTVKVAKYPDLRISHAKCYLRTPSEVYPFLKRVIQLKTKI